MKGVSNQTVSIPQFPFHNRDLERDVIETFISQRKKGARVLLLEGKGGLGKSRLLTECLQSVDSDVVVAALNTRQSGTVQRTLIQSISTEAKRLRSILAKSNRLEAWKLEIKQLGKHAKKIAPSAGSLVPIVGAVTKSALEIAIANRDPNADTAASWLNHFLAVCGILSTVKPVTIIVDDFHRLSADEQTVVASLLGGVIEVENVHLSVLVSTRPSVAGGDIASTFSLPASNGELIRLKLEPLSKDHLLSISHDIFANPGESKPLVELANGSPQKLLEMMIKLNIHGDLSRHENLVVLPNELTKLTYLIDNVWSEIEANKSLYGLAALMAVGTGSVLLTDTSLVSEVLGYETNEVLHAATILEQLGIFEVTEVNGNQAIQFSHDTLQEQIASRVVESSKIRFAFYNDVTARYLETVIARFLEPSNTENKDLLSLRIARARCLKDSATRGWESTALNVASQCLEEGRFQMGAELAESLIKQWKSVVSSVDKQFSDILSIAVRCHYALGDYERALHIGIPNNVNDPLADYSAIMATIIEKNNGWFAVAEQQIEKVLSNSEYHAFEPLFQSARAIALRETNSVAAGEAVLNEMVFKGGQGYNPEVWHQFLAISSLFQPAHQRQSLAQTALEFFRQEYNGRMIGIAATNLSIIHAINGDFEVALELGKEAEEGFKEVGSEDVIFPLLNKAAILLSTDQAQRAIPQLRSCLFRKVPHERKLAVLNNLALAQWAAGQPIEMDQLALEANRGENSWLRWISQTNLTFLELEGGKASFDQDRFMVLRDKLLENDPDRRSAPFWNWLLDQYPGNQTSELRFDTAAPSSPLEGLAVPERGIARPVFLSFGRI